MAVHASSRRLHLDRRLASPRCPRRRWGHLVRAIGEDDGKGSHRALEGPTFATLPALIEPRERCPSPRTIREAPRPRPRRLRHGHESSRLRHGTPPGDGRASRARARTRVGAHVHDRGGRVRDVRGDPRGPRRCTAAADAAHELRQKRSRRFGRWWAIHLRTPTARASPGRLQRGRRRRDGCVRRSPLPARGRLVVFHFPCAPPHVLERGGARLGGWRLLALSSEPHAELLVWRDPRLGGQRLVALSSANPTAELLLRRNPRVAGLGLLAVRAAIEASTSRANNRGRPLLRFVEDTTAVVFYRENDTFMAWRSPAAH